jgi:biopolymer transport protein TolR
MGMGSIGGKGRKSLSAEINVTPLVDVMLVLLIIFMVTAPMMTQGIDINLPKTTGESLPQDNQDKPLQVEINSAGQIFFGDHTAPLNIADLRDKLEKLPLERKEEAIYLQADEHVDYGTVVQVMAQIKQAGFDKLGMVTQPDEQKGAGGGAQQ